MIDPHEPPPTGTARGHGSAESSVLVIEGRDGARLVVPLVEEEIVLGRAAQGSTVRLPERDVSRRHARFTCSNGAVWVEDLGSSNGTRVNGERIQSRRRLREGDLVQLGGYDIAVLGASTLPSSLEPIEPAESRNARPQAAVGPAVSLPLAVASASLSDRSTSLPVALSEQPLAAGGTRGDVRVAPESRGANTAAILDRTANGRRTRMLIAAGLISLLVGWTAGRFLRLLH